jgi:hypothetical protein
MKHFWLLAALMSAQMACAQATSNRTALIIGVGEYGYTGPSSLLGVKHDMASASKIAAAMDIPSANIVYLRDAEATKANILSALKKLGEKTGEGSRAFVYFSGHGTRQKMGDDCVEGLLTYEGGTISNQEFANATKKLATSADKFVTLIDACHSEGVVPPQALSRRLLQNQLTPKFFSKADRPANACEVVSNMKTRSLLNEVTRIGGIQENFVQITSSRPDEVSLDQPDKGGLATQAMRDCLLGKAKDLNSSGAVSMDEIQQCAQSQINATLKGNPHFSPHHVTVSGNRNLIPVIRPSAQRPAAQSAAVAQASAPSPVASPAMPAAVPSSLPATTTPTAPMVAAQPTPAPAPVPVPTPVTAPAPVPALVQSPPPATAVSSTPAPLSSTPLPSAPPAAEAALASLATLKDIEQQRNPKRVVAVSIQKPSLKIGRDSLGLDIKSSHDGHVYLILLGSDAKSFYVLYPNGLDKDNAIKAGQTMRIPKPHWEVKAAGPVGTNHLLVMVADSPRRLSGLTLSEPTASEPFTFALNNLGGRSELIQFLTRETQYGGSESFGAKLISVKEVQ